MHFPSNFSLLKIIQYLSLFLFVLPLAVSCKRPAAERLVTQDELKWAILNSFHLPLQPGDTIIYAPERTGSFCLNGNQHRDRRTFYQPFLSKAPFRDTLLKRYEGKILFLNMKHSEYDNFYEEHPSLAVNKLFLDIHGTSYKKNKVTIGVSYSYNGISYYSYKLFTYTGNKWTYTVVEEGHYK